MKKNKTEKIFILLFALMLIVFFEPQMFKEESFVGVEKVDFVYKIAKLICFVITSIFYVKEKNFKISKLLLSIGILQVIMLISTIIYKGDLVRFVGPAITTVTMCMIAEILIKKQNLFSILKIVNIYFAICFIINVITVFLLDFTSCELFTRAYFMGIDNRFIFTMIPWVLFEGLVELHENGKTGIKFHLVFALCESLLLYKNSTSAMLVFFLYYFVVFSDKTTFKLKYSLFFSYVAANVLIVVFKIQNIFTQVVGMLGKDITFSGRTYLWDGILKWSYKYPLIGRGMRSIEYDKHFFYINSAPYYHEWCKVIHAHNSLMTLLYRGGILSVLIYLGIIFATIKSLYDSYSSKYARILGITLIIILIASIFDTMDFAALYFIITMIINIKALDIIKSKK